MHAPRIYFSLRSPYSWLALERLRRSEPPYWARFRMIPFWEPNQDVEARLEARGSGLHYVEMSKAKHLYILHDVRRIARGLGVEPRWPVDIDPVWEVPHLAWVYAEGLGAGQAFYDALMSARWDRGKNICDRSVVGSAGASVGLGRAEVMSACDDEAVIAKGLQCLEWAYEDDVFGVPYFKIGRHRFWGFDRVPHVIEALSQAEENKADRDVHGEGDGSVSVGEARPLDTDTVGGCG